MPAFILLVAAIALALCGQHVLTPLGGPRAFSQLPKAQAPLGFALLAAAGLLAAFVVWCHERRDAAAGAPPRRAAPRPRLLNAAVALVVVAVAAVLYDASSHWAIYPWAAGLALLVAAAWPPRRTEAMPRRAVVEWLGLALVVGVAVAFRFPGLEALPPQVHGDEAACGLEARRILRGEVDNLLGVGWYGIPNLSFAISALAMRLFGDDLFGLRMASALLGLASVPLLYGIVRRLYGAPAAFPAAYLLAVSHWHVHFSRIGTDYMQASFATVLAFFFFLRARDEQRAFDWTMAGLALGLACSVYYAGRVSVVVVAAVLAWDWLGDRRRGGADGRGTALMLLAAVLFVAPTVAVMAWSPSSLVERSSGVFVLSPGNLEHSRTALDAGGTGAVLATQVVSSLTAFNWMGEKSGQHAHPAPLLDFWTAALFALGVVAYTAVGWRRRVRLIALWFWSSLILGSVLTVDAMFSPRMIAAVPVIFVFAALVLDLFRSLAERTLGGAGRALAGLSLFAFLAAATVANYRDYFDLHVRLLQPPGAPTVLARFIQDLDTGVRAYVYGHHSVRYDTPRFLIPDADAVDMGDGPPRLPAPGRAAVVVADAGWTRAAELAAAVAAAYPDATHTTLPLADGRIAFHVYRLPSDPGL